MDVEITLDAVRYLSEYNMGVFFTGDSDFLALIEYLQINNKKVYIFSSKNNISEELRTKGDEYFDVLDIEADIWGKELKYREEK